MASPSDTNMELKPPDNTPQATVKASFRDTLIGNKDTGLARERVDLISNNLFRIEHEEGNRLKPRCYVSSNAMDSANSAHPQEDLHGDWLVVTRVKKNKNRTQGKGALVTGSMGHRNTDAKATQAPATSVAKQNASVSPNSRIVFQSKALPQPPSPNSRKKRHRTEPPAKEVSSSESQPSLTVPKAKSISVEDSNTFTFHPHGIQTMMNVEVLSSNRLRFRDEDDPVGFPSSKATMEGQDMASSTQGLEHIPDAVMEAENVPVQ
ncbi:putative Transposon TX1 [Sesbania bispinosa]|nr:putative Transposon TX1 [Sesbania bispinosa]